MRQTRDELDRWMQMRHWRPPPRVRYREHDFTRTEAIEVLEDAFVRLRGDGGNASILADLENELMMLYRDLDGEWDDLPFSTAVIPGIWRNLTLMHLCAYLDRFPGEAIAATNTDLDQSIMNDFFRSWTPLAREQVFVQSDKALVFLGEPEVSECQVHSVPLPHWVRMVEELIVSAVIVSGHHVTAKHIQESIVRCITSRYLEDLEI